MREFRRVLVSGQQDQLSAQGDYVYLKSAVGEIAVITESGNEVRLQQGQGVRFVRKFETLQVRNDYGLNQAFTLIVGSGDFQNNALVGEIGAVPVAGSGLVGLPLLTINATAQQVPSNSARRQLVIRAAAENAGVIWIGSGAVNVGLPLAAGDAAEIDITGALPLIGTNAGDVVYLAEVIA